MATDEDQPRYDLLQGVIQQKKMPYGKSPASSQAKDQDFNSGSDKFDENAPIRPRPSIKSEKPFPGNKSSGIVNVDDMVIPALSKGSGGNAMSEYADGSGFNEDEAREGEPIAKDKRALAEPLIQVFGEQTVRKIFSKTWGLREEGLGTLEQEIIQRQKYDPAEAFV